MRTVTLGERNSRWWTSEGPMGDTVRNSLIAQVEDLAQRYETDVTVYLSNGNVGAVVHFIDEDFDEDPTSVEEFPLPSLNDVEAWRRLYRGVEEDVVLKAS